MPTYILFSPKHRTATMVAVLCLVFLSALAQAEQTATLEQEVILFKSRDVMPKFAEAVNNEDQDTVNKMAQQGLIALLEVGTKIEAIGIEEGDYKVKVLNGSYAGSIGYISGPGETAQAKPPTSNNTAQVVRVTSDFALCAVDLRAVQQLEEAIGTKDNLQRIEKLIEQGRVLLLSQDTQLKVLNTKDNLFNVTILDGEQKGREGWVHSQGL